MLFGLFKKNLVCLGLILGIFLFLMPVRDNLIAFAAIFPFGGRVAFVFPPMPPPGCPCIQYVITNLVPNAVRVVAACPSIPTSIPRNNPSPLMGCAVLGIAIPNPIVTCPATYLPTVWGAAWLPSL